MRAPGFWSNPPDRPGWQARLLAPFSAVWRAASALRHASTRPRRVGRPVLCVGNLTAGGTGKTPMVAALMERLAARGVAAHVVSRGYGGRIAGPHLVDPLEDRAADVGDEPLLLAAQGPVWVARDRAAGAQAAVAAGARLILLDDGLQNPGLVKDGAIVMVDAGAGFGNARVIPAGPLREPVASGLARADLAVLVGDDAARAAACLCHPALAAADPLAARLVPVPMGLTLAGADVVAFAGIGRPAKFFDTLRAEGARLVEVHPFPDHHAYSPAILRRLIQRARTLDAMLVTTEKDAVRLPPDLRGEVTCLMVRLVLDDWTAIDALLDRLLGAAIARGDDAR